MTIYLLLILTIFILLLSYACCNKDVMAPSFLVCTGFLFSFICAAYNIKNWELNISLETIFILSLGILSVVLGDAFCKKVFVKKNKSSCEVANYIFISRWKCLVVILFCLIVLYLNYREVVRIANLNYVTSGNLIYNYKTNVVNADLEGASINSYVAQANKVVKAFAYIFLFVFLNNVFALKRISKQNKIKNVSYLLPGILYCLQWLIKGGRYETISYIISFVFLLYFFWRRKVGWKKEIPVKYITRIILLTGLIIGLFWISSEILGRKSASNNTAMVYLFKYFGGSLVNFDSYLKDDLVFYNKAHETFAHFVRDLNSWGLSNVEVVTSHEFRRAPSGIAIGNAHSAIRNYYHDFGVIGVVLMCLLFGVIFSFLYNKVIRISNINKKNSCLIIMYASWTYMPLFFFFTDYFFPKIGKGFLIELLLLWISHFFIFKIDFKMVGGKI